MFDGPFLGKRSCSIHLWHDPPSEDAVDRRVYDYGFVSHGSEAAKPGPRVRRLARNIHESYFDLIRAYDAHGYNGTVDRITTASSTEPPMH